MKPFAVFFQTFAFLVVLFGAASFSLAAPAEEEEDERDGEWLKREDGRFLFFCIEENTFHLEFYDEDRERISPDARRAAVHYTPRTAGTRETVILHPDRKTGETLTTPQHLRPPHVFKIVLVLVKGEDGRETETFSFRYEAKEE